MADGEMCTLCGKALTKDENGLSRKIFENDTKNGIWRCIRCMAEYLECNEDELLEKIEEFKASGCKLFG